MQPDPARMLAARELVGSYTAYADAQRAVDFLSDEKFPVERSAISVPTCVWSNSSSAG